MCACLAAGCQPPPSHSSHPSARDTASSGSVSESSASGHSGPPAREGDAHEHDHAYRHDGADPHHRFDDPERWAKLFEDPGRDEWQKPSVVVDRMELDADAVVADIGSATGYFPVRLARAVTNGRVWGVDIEPSMVRHLNERARREGLDHLFSILGTAADPLLPERVDAVLMVNTYHHVQERPAYFRRLRRDLTGEGRVVIVDFKQGDLPVGPPDAMKIPPDQVIEELAEAGYSVAEDDRSSLPYQFILIFEATGRSASKTDD